MSVTARADYEFAIVGGGIVGLASALSLTERRPNASIVLFEREPALARHQTGRNSGVIHAGLYYAAGSLKARLCREGRRLLMAFADARSIPYDVNGKLVVARDRSELERLSELERRGNANGLDGLRRIGSSEIAELEPHVTGFEALVVPETASIDYSLVAQGLGEELAARGVDIRLGERVVGIDAGADPCRVRSERSSISATSVLTCGGVQADRLASLTGAPSRETRIVPFRGDYYRLSPSAAALVRGHVYPVPDPTFPFLGVHFSRRIDGEVWAGPNAVPAFARLGYGRLSFSPRDTFDAASFPGTWRLARRYWRTGVAEMWRDVRKRAALKEMQRYVPELRIDDIEPGRSGIRAQLLGRDGSLVDDFTVVGSGRVTHILNAPSPAATASLAIGELVADRLLAAS